MFKLTCLFFLITSGVSCIPLETTSSKTGLDRPSPINPEIISDPKPQEDHSTTPANGGSHIQKIPARGTKLSAELAQSTSTEQSTLVKRQATSTSNTAKVPAGAPRQLTTTTAEPVSLKTPIVHPARNRRSSNDSDNDDDNSTQKPSTTRGPLVTNNYSSSNNNDDDGSGPHFVRPVPVDQILKNLHAASPRQSSAPLIATHAPLTSTTAPSASDDGDKTSTTVNDHKFHRRTTSTTTTEQPQSEEDSREDDKDSSEDEQ